MGYTTVFRLMLPIIFLWARSSANVDDYPSFSNTVFIENKGHVRDQFFHPRPDILFSGINGNLVYHLKSNGHS